MKANTILPLALVALLLITFGCAAQQASAGSTKAQPGSQSGVCAVGETSGCLERAANTTGDDVNINSSAPLNDTANNTGAQAEPSASETDNTTQNKQAENKENNTAQNTSSTQPTAEQNSSLAIVLALITGTGVQNATIASGEGKTINGSYADFITKLRAEVLPTEADLVRPYLWKNKSVKLDSDGFTALIEMDSEISVSSLPEYRQKMYEWLVGRDENGNPRIDHPCCAAPVGECGCGHAMASKGLAKFLLQEGWGEEEILKEELMWNKLFFPNLYLQNAIDEKVKSGEIEYNSGVNIKGEIGGC